MVNACAVHVPLVQIWPMPQTIPQPPQLVESLLVLTSHPLEVIWSQSANPDLHERIPHCEFIQELLALARLQVLPQAPQLAVLLVRSVSQPSAVWLLQSPKPGRQELILHAPVVHTLVACGRLQVLPQAPQLAVLLVRSVSQPSAVWLLQSPKPGRQELTLHAPVVHTLVACGRLQAAPQPPQLLASVC